jgi:hypothetical protein
MGLEFFDYFNAFWRFGLLMLQWHVNLDLYRNMETFLFMFFLYCDFLIFSACILHLDWDNLDLYLCWIWGWRWWIMAKCVIFETMVTFIGLWFRWLYLVIPIFCFLRGSSGSVMVRCAGRSRVSWFVRIEVQIRLHEYFLGVKSRISGKRRPYCISGVKQEQP